MSTKRGIVSDTARSFDVLGWMAPFIIRMKVLFQSLWKEKKDWDAELTEELTATHVQWRSELPVLRHITLPRCYFSNAVSTSIQLHGFSDASVKAYAGTVYIRATYEDGTITSRLVVAKTRVAPLHTVSIPRLELCGAELLSDLLSTVQNTLSIPDSDVFAWCDSTVALAWLRSYPSDYKVFVANRIASAARNIPQAAWLHVPTEDNPADCASRGISAQELQHHHLWWGGPPWLLQEPVQIPPQPTAAELSQHKLLEAKSAVVHATTGTPKDYWGQGFSSYSKLLHVSAYVLRFCANLKAAIQGQPRKTGQNLEVSEVQEAEVMLFKHSQERSFPEELNKLSAATPSPISRSSTLRGVGPILSQEKLLLVEGRLDKANISARQKQPVILSAADWLTKMVFVHYHVKLMHCGSTLLLAHTATLIYVIGAKKLAKTTCQNCLLCRRKAPRPHAQKMGQLPAYRVNRSFMFIHTGVDYAGPFFLKQGNPRRPTITKCWLALFVCLATKLVHIEVVSSASTEAYIAAHKRFAYRKGMAKHIYSDHGSNFVGARNQMKELYDFLSLPSTDSAISDHLLSNRITWHHIPERAPHFGGIWEAVVKSAKHHMRKIIGHIKLSFEELTTTTCGIEACLNSRPYLAQDSHDAEGEMPLTPGHFLIGRPLMTYPEAPADPATTLKSRWEL